MIQWRIHLALSTEGVSVAEPMRIWADDPANADVMLSRIYRMLNEGLAFTEGREQGRAEERERAKLIVEQECALSVSAVCQGHAGMTERILRRLSERS